jgi:Trk-type K+ transport system membrane component
MTSKAMGPRIIGTILVGVFWFAFIVLYLAFFAQGMDLWQKAAIFLASGAIALGLVAVFWVKWALSQ